MDYVLQELAQLSSTINPGVSESALRAAEQKLGATFPAQYRELLKIVNAPEFFDWQFFPIKEMDDSQETSHDIVHFNKSKQRGFLQEQYIAFAESCGDYLCFKAVNGAMEDAVYIQSPEIFNPEPVATDLTAALLEMLSYEDDEELEFEDDHEEDEE